MPNTSNPGAGGSSSGVVVSTDDDIVMDNSASASADGTDVPELTRPAQPLGEAVLGSGFVSINKGANGVCVAGDKAEKKEEDEDEEEVIGGGCIVANGNIAPIAATLPLPLPAELREANIPPQEARTVLTSEKYSDKNIDSGSRHDPVLFPPSLVSPSTRIEEASLIPPSLQDPSSAYNALCSKDRDSPVNAAFESLYSGEGSGPVVPIDDDRPVSSQEDYAAVTREAHGHWRARSKQPTGIFEQSSADIRDFMAGSARRRLRLVLIQLHDLIDKAPKVYALLERKNILEGSLVTQSRVERALNSLWGELKARCSLLVLDKDASHAVVRQCPLVDHEDGSDKVEHVKSLVLSVISDIAEHCLLLWELFESSVRGLVLVNSGAEIINRMWHLSQDSVDIQQSIITTLLGSYAVMPDLYKVTIKEVIEGMVALDNPKGMRLIVMELQRYKALPSVLFRTLSKAMRTAEMADEVRLRLDELLHTGAGTWVGFTTSGVRPKYAQAGSELRDALLGQFAALLPSAKRRHVFSYMRVISGLIGYLRLDVTGADFEFFKQAAGTTSDHRNSADVCAALFLVLAGFGTRTSNQNIMLAIVDVSESPVARQIDCLLAHLVTDQVKDVNSFVTSALAMDFSYPRDRLFYLKDIASDSTTSYFSRASLARRLVACPSPSAPCEGGVNSVPTALHRAAVLNFLRSATFQNSGVDVREWMTRLMRGADTATANACGPLVRAYVSAIFSSPSITPVPETLLWSEFAAEAIKDSACHHAPPSQVLFLMYVLYYCEQLLEQPKRPNSAFSVLARRPAVVAPPLVNGVQPRAGPFGISVGANSSRAGGLGSLALGRTAGPGRGSPLTGLYDVVKRGEYSDQLLDSLPVSWILHKVGRDTEYQLVWPELLSMATAQHPDQLDVVSVLQRELAAGFSQESSHLGADSGGQQLPRREAAEFASSGSTADFFKQIKAARMLIGSMLLPSNSDEPPSIRALRFTVEEYSKLSVSVRMVMCGLLAGQLCRAAVAGYDDNELTASVRQTWLSLHALSPHAVSAATVNAWRSEAEAIKPRLAAQDIWLDPLVVFRSDTRVFQSASLVDILLVVLGEFLVLSRTSMRRIYALRQRDDGALKKSHLTALIQLQESSALQLLIETARFVQDDEVKWLVYEFIHARFLEQRTIQKLVHFQAYAIEAIDDMVGYVPSMHACSEFIPELLMQSAPRLQLFAIKLAAAITTKYPIMANEGMAKEVILPHIQTTLVQIAGTAIAEQLAISNAMLAAVVSIGCAFPTIREECRRLVAAVKDSAVERARSVHQAQAQVQAQPVQLQHQQQNFARWIGCCEHVVALIDAPDQDERPQFVHIEDTEAGKIAIRLEKLFQPDKGGHAGHIASPRLADFSGQPLPANGPPVPPGALRPPGPPPPHFHPSHQSAQQYGVPPGQQKRSHSLITGGSSGGERGDRGGRMSAQRDAGGPPLDYSRSRGGNASGTGSSRLPDHMSGHSSGGISPGGNAGSSGNFKKRSRHRSGNAGGGNNPKSHGHGGPNKRGKAPGGERPHIKDH